jgi:ATP adenylyltransferase
MEYIESAGEKQHGCIFCVKPGENDDRKNLIAFRGKTAFVILNRYPYNNGHVMVVPYQHTAELSALDVAEQTELFRLLSVSQTVIRRLMKPDGFNVGMNLGRVAGAGVDDHLHFHLVPRWNGDTNFMPVTGCTKVMSEGLEITWKKMTDAFSVLKNIQ